MVRCRAQLTKQAWGVHCRPCEQCFLSQPLRGVVTPQMASHTACSACRAFPCCVKCLAEAVKSSADAAAREQLAKVVEVLVADKVASFEDCIAWARLKFQVGRA